MRATTRLFGRIQRFLTISAEACPNRRCRGGARRDGSTCPRCAGSGVFFRL